MYRDLLMSFVGDVLYALRQIARRPDPRLSGRQVVGVVADAQLSSPTAYVLATPGEVSVFLVRASRDRIMRELGPRVGRLPPSVTLEVLTGSAWIAPAAGPTLLGAYVSMAFGVVALLLGTVGFFSLLEYAVRQRTREIGIRMALGAEPRHVVRALLAPASRALGRGLLMGSAGAVCVGYFMRRADTPAGVNPLDVVTYAAVAGVLVIAGLLASYVPAHRAIRIAPSEALRFE